MSRPTADLERMKREAILRAQVGKLTSSVLGVIKGVLDTHHHGVVAGLDDYLTETAPVAIPRAEWCEADGPALWWAFPIEEPPYSGSPIDTDWPGYHTHWTRLVIPSPQPINGGGAR